MVAASVEGYLRDQSHKLAPETQGYPSFKAGLLREASVALNGLKSASKVAFEDPISGSRVELNAIPQS